MRKIFITGAGQGLGRELAKGLDQENSDFYLFGRDEGKLKSTLAMLSNASAKVIPCSLENEAELKQKLSELVVDPEDELILVNNAATWTGGKLVQDITPSEMLEAFQLNFMSAYNLTHLILGKRREGQLTKIINIGATASMRGGRYTSSFAIAKSSLRILTQSLAREMGPDNVHACHLIIDGLINNERTRVMNPKMGEQEFISMDSLVGTLKYIIDQPKDCWTLELDVRPGIEKF